MPLKKCCRNVLALFYGDVFTSRRSGRRTRGRAWYTLLMLGSKRVETVERRLRWHLLLVLRRLLLVLILVRLIVLVLLHVLLLSNLLMLDANLVL